MTPIRLKTSAALLIGSAVLITSPASANQFLGAALEDHLKAISNQARSKDDKEDAEKIAAFYEKRGFKSIWMTQGVPNTKAKILLVVLEKAGEHGLNPESYKVAALKANMDKMAREAPAEFEMLMSRTYLRYAADVCCGRIQRPTKLGVFRDPRRPDMTSLLTQAAETDNFHKVVNDIAPTSERYLRLKQALVKYRALAAKGGWNKVAAGPTIKPGMKHPRVAQARARLRITGDLTAAGPDPLVYDKEMVEAVKRYQLRNGLAPDGAIGPTTVAVMNVPVEQRVAQIIINMERRRWTMNQLGSDYIWVNIADTYLKLVRNGKTTYVARVVVGKVYHKTPIFSKRLDHIRFNPHWNVPYSIATKEMLPIIRKNPGYLASRNYLLLTRPLDNDSAINPHSVDWSTITRRNFPYFIRQKPGPGNALGTMIFMFPNRHNVFIHDTAARSKFNANDRFFSHGCVRVQHPRKLAYRLLKEQGWTRERIARTVAARKPVRFKFKHQMWVHITYMTAWANKAKDDASGKTIEVNFRRDFYRRDPILMNAFKAATGLKDLK